MVHRVQRPHRTRRGSGNPDLVFPKHKVAIFVHGCFWHRHSGCKRTTTPKTNIQFWQRKFDSNVARDRRVSAALTALGWRVVVIWECETRVDDRLTEAIRGIFGLGAGKERGVAGRTTLDEEL